VGQADPSPQEEHRPGGDDERQVVHRRDALGYDPQHDERRREPGEDGDASGDVVEESGPEARPHRDRQSRVVEAAVGEQRHRARAPAVLLAHEPRHPVGAQSPGEEHWDVAKPEPALEHRDAGVDVLTVADLREPARGLERCAPVQRVGAHADRRADAVPRRLHPPVEELLHRSGAAFEPGARRARVEVLRALDDADARVLEVGRKLAQHVGHRAEVGVQDEDEVAVRPTVAVREVAGLLHPTAVGTADVGEAELLGERADLGPAGVV